jgi:hypothetical protein
VANQIKEYFERSSHPHYFSVFMAHEDISPSDDFQQTILKELNQTELFLLLCSEKSLISEYCNQEIGFAIAKTIPIFIVLDNCKPPAFLSNYQGVELKGNVYSSCKKIIKKIQKIPEYDRQLKVEVVNSLEKSDNWRESNELITKILKIDSFPKDLVLRIIDAGITNYEVNRCWKFDGLKNWIINNYKSYLPHDKMIQLIESGK